MFRSHLLPLCTLWLSVADFVYCTGGNMHLKAAKSRVSVFKDVPGPPNLENLVVRHNGEIFVTSHASPSIFRISPKSSVLPIAIAQIPNATALTGIIELQENVFIVAAADPKTPGSNAVWRLDMRPTNGKNKSAHAVAELSLLARIPFAQVLNGMTQLANNDTSHVLISDSAAGNILRLNVVTGEYVVVISHPTMLPESDGLNAGVNGIHTWGDQLFYTSLDQGIFATVPISRSTGAAKGPVDIILNGTLRAADDFALSRDGLTAWITENGEFVLVEVDMLSKTSRIALNDTILASTSSVALGRSCSNWNSVFITGANLNANGTAVQGRVFEAKLDITVRVR